MPQITPISGSVFIQAQFSKPLLNWTAVPDRFFGAVYKVLGETLYIRPSDFFSVSGNSPGDSRAGFRIYGGNRGIALTPEGLSIEFPDASFSIGPGITEQDLNLVNHVISKFINAIVQEFVELEVETAKAVSNYHFEIISGETFEDLVPDALRADLPNSISEQLAIPVNVGYRVGLLNASKEWKATVTIEKSDEIIGGVFISRDIVFTGKIHKVEPLQYFEEAWNIDQAIYSSLGSEVIFKRKESE